MLLTVGLVVLALWVLGLIGHIGGGLINLLLIIGLIVLIVHFVRGRGTDTTV
jgi:hypothetical protein